MNLLHARAVAPLTALLCLSVLHAAPAQAFSPKVDSQVAEQAARLMPVSLQTVLASNIARLDQGTAAIVTAADVRALREGSPEALETLENAAFAQTQRVLDLLTSRAPMSTVAYEMGVLSHIVALASDPVNTSDDDAREDDWSSDFEAFTESRLPRFHVVFDGYSSPSLDKDDVKGFFREVEARSRRHYGVLSSSYVGAGGGIAKGATFDDRHPVFGIASLGYAHAIGDTARLWLYVWIRANGDTTGLPFPQALPAGTVQASK